MPVTTCEMAGSPTGGHDGSGPYRKRRVRVAWSDIDTFSSQLLPVSVYVGQNQANYSGELFPGSDVFRVATFTFQPMFGESDRTDAEDSFGNMSYDYAVFDIDYRVPKSETGQNPEAQELDPVQLLEHSFESDGEFLTLPKTKLFWEGSGNPLSEDANAGIFVPVTRHTVTWPRVLSPNWAALTGLKGTVNASDFIFRGYSHKAQTLLYLGYSGGQEVMSDGERAWKLTLKFSVKYITSGFFTGDAIDRGYASWNDAYNEDSHAWDTVCVGSVGATKRTYSTSDFTQLFRAGT